MNNWAFRLTVSEQYPVVFILTLLLIVKIVKPKDSYSLYIHKSQMTIVCGGSRYLRIRYADLPFFTIIFFTKSDICAKIERNRWFKLYHLLPGFLIDTVLESWLKTDSSTLQAIICTVYDMVGQSTTPPPPPPLFSTLWTKPKCTLLYIFHQTNPSQM